MKKSRVQQKTKADSGTGSDTKLILVLGAALLLALLIIAAVLMTSVKGF